MRIQSRITVLDSVRGLAALLVFVFHAVGLAQTFRVWHHPVLSESVALLGPLGTNLLLLLCGFWITISLRKPGFELLPFLRNRLVRIYVPYVVVVMLSYSAWAFMPSLAVGKAGWGIETTLSNLLLLPGLFPERPALTVAWTLSYVVAAYLSIPLLVQLVGGGVRRRTALWITLIGVPFVLIASGYPMAHRIAYIPLGCLLAEAYSEGKVKSFLCLRHPWLLCGIGLFLVARFELLVHRDAIGLSKALFLLVLFSTGAGIATLAMGGAFRLAAIEESGGDTRALKALQWMGQRGYSIYLFHGPVTKLVMMAAAALSLQGAPSLCGILLVSATLTFLVADCSHKWLETLTASWVSRKLTQSNQPAFANSL